MVTNLIDLAGLLEDDFFDEPNLTSEGGISPFLLSSSNIRPGRSSKDLYKFNQIFPVLFKRKTGFMGIRPNTDSLTDELAWKFADKVLFYQEGHFDSGGEFHAPMAVYESKGKLLLVQEGSYQILSGGEEITSDGKIKIYRGIHDNPKLVLPTIKDIREDYFKSLAVSFLSPTLALSIATQAYRWETDHVRHVHPTSKLDLGLSSISRSGFVIQPSFSLDRLIASKKFGPNYISLITPLDNLRIFTQWCGENEVYLLDPNRVESVRLNRD